MFDEMAIRQQLEYVSGTICGHVDFDSSINTDETLLAKEVLVFCVVCLSEKWKVLIAYYLMHSLSAEKKANLINQCLTSLHEINFKIISLTFDSTANNFTVLKTLGCNFKINHFKTYFQHPVSKEKVFVFLDASHMLIDKKYVRSI